MSWIPDSENNLFYSGLFLQNSQMVLLIIPSMTSQSILFYYPLKRMIGNSHTVDFVAMEQPEKNCLL